MEQEADELTVTVGEDFSLDAQRLTDNPLYSETSAIDHGADVPDDDSSPEPGLVGCTVP
jgi:hypothetical protein